MHPVLLGCAGWSLPRDVQGSFPADGSHLERYAARFPAVEINSSFYQPHRASTYARWAASVPPSFCFSVKMPKSVTHQHRLIGTTPLMDSFLAEVGALGDRLACLLVQLPPSLICDVLVAEDFFTALRSRYSGGIAFEPRHPSWFTTEVERLLNDLRVARVAADPAPAEGAGQPAGWSELVYYRLHGSPAIYYSAYGEAYLADLAERLAKQARAARQVWCIFDNTAAGAALPDAFELMRKLDGLEAKE